MKKIWVILIVVTMGGCKPVQTVQEKYITTEDSTEVMMLKEMLEVEVKKNENLTAQLERKKQEKTKLTNETESHEIRYDISAPVDKETGKYPIASETITTSRSVLEHQIKEQKRLLQEQGIEISVQAQRNKNLEYQMESLKNENSELKTKTTKCGFSFKWMLYGLVAGSIITIIGLALWKMK